MRPDGYEWPRRRRASRFWWPVIIALVFGGALGLAIGSILFDYAEQHGVSALPWLSHDYRTKP